jgi:hypothetical protein
MRWDSLDRVDPSRRTPRLKRTLTNAFERTIEEQGLVRAMRCVSVRSADSPSSPDEVVSRRHFLHRRIVGALGLSLWSAGCQLLSKPLSLSRARSTALPPIRTSADAISLEFVFIDRPAGDPLLGSPLWNHVDQMASLDTSIRSMLRQNGLRTGVLSAHPPESLQSMLGLKTSGAASRPKSAVGASGLEGRRVSVPPGGTTQVHVNPFYESAAAEADLIVEQATENRSRHYHNLRCVYQVAARRLQDGWVHLDFVPQVHHGEQHLRPKAGADDWQFDHAQSVDTFHAQRFSLPLNEGEMAVVTADDTAKGTLGDLFFRERSAAATIQRVLLVRLCDAGRPTPVYAEP